MFAGIGEYMTKVLAALAPSTMEIKVVAPPERKDSCKDSTLIMQLLRDNLTLWTSDQEGGEP